LFTDREFHDTRVPIGAGGDPNDPGRYEGIELLRADPFGVAGEFSDERDGRASLLVEFLAPKGHDWGQFKTPSLRNVAMSAPYMHHGQFATLEQVVRFYSTRENERPAPHADPLLRALSLSEQQVHDLVAFLDSLTNQSLSVELLRAPDSPAR
jgi:cytochrome c peroxidase